ncbi:MAG TPA: glycosyltransferase family 39 protein [Anaerolineales bacterium]
MLIFVPAIISGTLLAHILWPDRSFWSVLFKVFLGIGLGLGLRSLLYFLYLLAFPGSNAFIYVEGTALLALLAIAATRELRRPRPDWNHALPSKPTRIQGIVLAIGSLVCILSLLATANYLLRRRQGDWDAWMMYNRAARFIYFDQAHWLGSFSPEMSPIFHADYPLLLASDIVAGWELLGRDSAAVPMVQSALFAIACAGLLGSSLGAVKSLGQAALGITLLWGVPVFVNEGARQMADVPLAFFILATGVLFFLYATNRQRGLLVLAGIAVGLGAWTKNEGTVLVVGAVASVLLAFVRRDSWTALLTFAAGLAVPLAVVIYFKLFLAPSGDILLGASGGLAAKLADVSRHTLIIQYLWNEFTAFGSWGIWGISIGILPILAVYYLVFRSSIAQNVRAAYLAGLAMLGIQVVGYYAAYLVSPYDLAWHLSYSSTRIVAQVFPLILFLTLAASREAEQVLTRVPSAIPE